ncbi:hypothetical protein VO178_12915 [Lysinibacillus fusiformis]|uniref:hypothetical protein n=1 Tax=Lysinibacillus fusiformis TaxID=28031 RepID=UPI002D782CCD|nr:hypothetical protein [Lysinibacillus fusiformis]WRS96292.1 hypothetical protein VO178_12915 [Lysinibacillus fusiformis]
MTVKNRNFICFISGLALFLVGAYKIFTDHLEAMSLLVAYIFFVCGFIGMFLVFYRYLEQLEISVAIL